MAVGNSSKFNIMPIVSKVFCPSSQKILVVRRRPHVINGGGFVVTDCDQGILFRVDGCGVLGSKGEIVLRDGQGEALLLLQQKDGIVQALNMYKQWRGYSIDVEGLPKLVFSLKEFKPPCLSKNNTIKISVHPRISNKAWDFEIKGYFPNKECRIVDHHGITVAQVGMKKEIEKLMTSKDLYQVTVKEGIDQAFVVGVIAILDYIYGESTRC